MRWLWVLPLALGACSSELDVQYHGRVRIAEGDYRVLTSFSHEQEEFALVVDLSSDDGRLLLIPFGDQDACTAPEPAAAFFAVQTRQGPRIAVYGGSTRPRPVQFIDERCRTHLEPQPDSVDVDFESSFFLVETASGELHRYDPWNDEQTRISARMDARGSLVDRAGRGGFVPDALWLLEGDELVLRDFAGRELGREGDRIREIAVAGSQQEMIFSDSRGLYRLTQDGSPAERIGDPGCELAYEWVLVSSDRAYLASMLSPCQERRLVLVVPPDDEVVTLADDVVSHFRHQRVSTAGEAEMWTFYATQSESAGDERRYFMVEPDGETTHELDVPLSRRSFIYQVEPRREPAPRWLFITDEEEPRLGTWSAGAGFSTIAERARALVSSPAGLLLLRDVDPELGGTLQLFDGRELETIARHVPEEGLIDLRRSPPPSSLSSALRASALDSADSIVHDFDGNVGTLSVLQPSGELSELAREVPLSSTQVYLTAVRGSQLAEPLEGAQVLAYLEGYDAESRTGRLSVLLPNGQVLAIDEGVGSHTASSDPNRPGLLYAVRKGKHRGLWFARQ